MIFTKQELQQIKEALEEAAIERGYDLTDKEGAYGLLEFKGIDPERADVYIKVCEELLGAIEGEVIDEAKQKLGGITEGGKQ